jgi:hypothetical protein
MGKVIIGIIAIILLIYFWPTILGLGIVAVAIAVIVAIVKKISATIRRSRNRRTYTTPLYTNASASRSRDHSMTYIELGASGRQDVYVFNYTQVGSLWRAYIMSSPSYSGRASGAHETHRYYDNGRRLHYICFSPEPRSLGDIKQVSKAWANCTTQYIDTGKRF